MKRILVAMIAMGGALLLTPASPAAAATVDAAAFAADCNADGAVSVSGTLQVVGGTGNLTAEHCFVTIGDGSKLVFRGVTLGDAGCAATCGLIVGESGAGSVIKVLDSTIDVSGAVQLSAGCCSGGDVPEDNGVVRVLSSTVAGGESVEISASVATNGGLVVARDSAFASSSGSVAINTFAEGTTIATDNTIAALTYVDIHSGFDPLTGSTTAKRNHITAGGPVTITASGGVCISHANVPAVACS